MELGVGIAWQRGDEWLAHSLELLTPQVYTNWIHDQMADDRYLPMAFSAKCSYADGYIAAAQAHPGKLWLLGNEPELSGTRTEPQEAADFAARWQAEVGGAWAGFGVMVTDAGLAWLDSYLASGGPLVTHWHIHLYWQDTTVGWVADWMRWVRWMRAHEVVRPTVVSETNLWRVAGDEAKRTLDKATDGTLPDADLLHSVLWYSDCDYHDLWHWSDLRNEDGTLTELGDHFVTLVTLVTAPPDDPKPDPPGGVAQPEPDDEPQTFLPRVGT